jgi:hypothetical protein
MCHLNYKGRLVTVVAPDQHFTEDQIPGILKRLHMIHLSRSDASGEGLRKIVDTLKGAA